MRKQSYENGQDEFELNSDKDNFPILTNDELKTKLDRFENKNRKGEPLEEDEEETEEDEGNKGKVLQPSDSYENFYGKVPGLEGLMSYPLQYIPGDQNPEDYILNPYQNIYQKANNSSKYLRKLAENFKTIMLKQLNNST